MIRRLALGLLLAAPCALAAQEGSIAYKHVVRLDIPPEVRAFMEARGANRPGGRGGFPTERVSDVVLIFNAAESLMKPVPQAAAAPGQPEVHGDVIVLARPGGPPSGGPPPGMAGEHGVVVQRMRASSATRRDRETILEAHVRFEDETIVESREFLGRTFLIEDDRPALSWKLTGEQAEFLGYLVQKATAVQDSTTIEAWFTPQIPVPGGPAFYGGLPGMILAVSLDDGKVQYTATQVALTEVAEGVIVRPTKGEKVDRARYERIVAEKLQELRTVGSERP